MPSVSERVIIGLESVSVRSVPLIRPVAPRVVKLPAAAVVAPTVAPSTVPPLISVVVSTELARVTTPVESAIEPAEVPSLALRFVASILVVSTVVAFKVVNVKI